MPHIKNNDVRERKTEETISNGKENLKEKNLKKKKLHLRQRKGYWKS